MNKICWFTNSYRKEEAKFRANLLERHLYSHRQPITRAPQALFVPAGYCLHRMSLRSVRNDSRSLYDRCAFAGIDEGIIRARSDGGTGVPLGMTASEFRAQHALRSARYGALSDYQLSY
jgi:hypothetical protein